MEITTVRSLLALIEPNERVEVDFPGFSSGVFQASCGINVLSEKHLSGRVTCVWRSVYDKIVIEAEVSA